MIFLLRSSQAIIVMIFFMMILTSCAISNHSKALKLLDENSAEEAITLLEGAERE